MVSEDAVMALIVLIGIVSIAIGVFFAFRGIYRFKEWQAGEKDELWMFLSMIIGCVGLLLIGIPSCVIIIGDVPSSVAYPLVHVFFVGLILGLGAIGLTTFYYFLKWRPAK